MSLCSLVACLGKKKKCLFYLTDFVSEICAPFTIVSLFPASHVITAVEAGTR